MRITIDNLDGAGPRDYTYAVPAYAKGGSSLTVQRGLNVPSRCTVEIVLGAEGLAMPRASCARRGHKREWHNFVHRIHCHGAGT
jgi:hypothetical protein